jgi:hypothetical protein
VSALYFFGRPYRVVRDQDAANKEAPPSSCPYPILSRFCPELVEKAAPERIRQQAIGLAAMSHKSTKVEVAIP